MGKNYEIVEEISKDEWQELVAFLRLNPQYNPETLEEALMRTEANRIVTALTKLMQEELDKQHAGIELEIENALLSPESFVDDFVRRLKIHKEHQRKKNPSNQ